ncbi:indole-3-glycerol phosphate synthase TrpC [Paenalkalicoccus suaedae]|nr:indole-3-glycerol phosphate synthase TrpC [Paenalkalicoccus suaedae]
MTILDTIVERKKQEVQLIEIPSERLVERERLSLVDSIKKSQHPMGIIAEVKKASPSKGILVQDFDPLAIAEEYEKLQVAGISVLTDKDFFQGDDRYLTAIKEAVSIPILRKDFIIDHKQVMQADRIGSDAILLIAAILDGTQLKELYEHARELSMDVLVEVHNEEEIEKVVTHIKPELIGVNNRNLKTFETSLANSERLKPYLPKDALFISESGIATSSDTAFLNQIGVDGLLVGEGFMKSDNKHEFLKALFGDQS